MSDAADLAESLVTTIMSQLDEAIASTVEAATQTITAHGEADAEQAEDQGEGAENVDEIPAIAADTCAEGRLQGVN